MEAEEKTEADGAQKKPEISSKRFRLLILRHLEYDTHCRANEDQHNGMDFLPLSRGKEDDKEQYPLSPLEQAAPLSSGAAPRFFIE